MLIGGLVATGLIVTLLLGTIFHQSLKYFWQIKIFSDNLFSFIKVAIGRI